MKLKYLKVLLFILFNFEFKKKIYYFRRFIVLNFESIIYQEIK